MPVTDTTRKLATPKNLKPTITTNAFYRSHLKQPRGNGGWAFAPSRTMVAYHEHIDYDAMVIFDGPFSTAKKQAIEHFASVGWYGYVAVLS